MELITALFTLIAFSVLSFWKGIGPTGAVLWLFTGALSIITGLLFFDKYPDYAGLTFGIILTLGYTPFCLAQGYQALLRGHETED